MTFDLYQQAIDFYTYLHQNELNSIINYIEDPSCSICYPVPNEIIERAQTFIDWYLDTYLVVNFSGKTFEYIDLFLQAYDNNTSEVDQRRIIFYIIFTCKYLEKSCESISILVRNIYHTIKASVGFHLNPNLISL